MLSLKRLINIYYCVRVAYVCEGTDLFEFTEQNKDDIGNPKIGLHS